MSFPLFRRLSLINALFIGWLCSAAGASTPGEARPDLLLVTGTEGEAEFRQPFAETRSLWIAAAEEAGYHVLDIGPESDDQLDRFTKAMQGIVKESAAPLWIVFSGHGTDNGLDAKFNMAGPDISAIGLRKLLQEFKRTLFFINASSASGPWLRELSGADRVVITATKSGHQVDYSRFGLWLARSLSDKEADIDNDGQNTLLELFLHASRRTNEFYEQEGRIATEEALLDDNADSRGSTLEILYKEHVELNPAKESEHPDGILAQQWSLNPSEEEKLLPPEIRQERNRLEREVFDLRRQRATLKEENYYRRLEDVLTKLATLYAGLDGEKDDASPEAESEAPEETPEAPEEATPEGVDPEIE